MNRFEALVRALIDGGYLSADYADTTTPIRQIDFVGVGEVRVFWREGPNNEAQALIDRWPWGAEGRDPLEDDMMIPQTKQRFASTDPLANMMRVFGRHCWDRMNEIAEFVGMPKKQGPAIFGEIEAYIDAKLRLPGLGPDLEVPTDGG